jgi:plasmid maintenance system antidote protein VapI
MSLRVVFVMKKLTENEVLAIIRKEVESTSGREVAKRIGVHPSYISDILKGKRNVSEFVAASFGFEREVLFKRIA